ncbi:MAG: Rne/Rng family ribonuclease [Planctomycetes bacterium]|nr:Rne/Rng family ribonuclease [Planctomycetota bacterium]
MTQRGNGRPPGPQVGPGSSGPEGEAPQDEPEPDVPAWVDPDVAEAEPRFLHGRAARGVEPELLPAGGGLDPGGDDAEDSPPAVAGAVEEAPRAAARAPRRAAPRELVQKRVLVNADDPEEVRIAVLEDGRLEELYYERPHEKKYVGNIYKGRVVNLEPAIQAAFVDIGIGRNGFLHVSDVLPAYRDSTGVPIDLLSVRPADRQRLRIQDTLRKGQEMLVQISKDAIGAKGPSLTTYVSIPGKYLVLMPGVSRHGVSKRIADDGLRADLRERLAQLNPPKGVGYIVRTAGRDRGFAELEKDFLYIMKIWEEIRAKVMDGPATGLVYAESDLVTRTMRDLLGPDVSEILIDDPGVHENARTFVEEVMPHAAPRLIHYSGTSPLFSRFGVEEEIEKIYNRRVPLPSGGHIVLEQTEALVAIDVNSGKYRDEEDLEATALKTNLEAAQEIARQLRLRDLGGVIVNDFIDMESEANRRAVERALRMALRRDRAKSWISRISRFGIIEMTRQRVRPSFERSNHEPCGVCRGAGVVKSARSTGTGILRQVRAALAMKRRDVCEVIAHPSVVDYLLNERRRRLVELEDEFQKSILVRADPSFSPDQHEIRYR